MFVYIVVYLDSVLNPCIQNHFQAVFTVLIGIIGFTGYAQKTTKSKNLFSNLLNTNSFSIKKNKPLASKKQGFKLSTFLLSESIAQHNNTSPNNMPIAKPKGSYSIPNYFEDTEEKRSLIIIEAK